MNMLDYLDWRGDLSFEAAALNEIDALIFAWLIYARFEEFEEEGIDDLTLAELAALYERKRGPFQRINLNTTISPASTAAWLLHRAAATPRFAGVRAKDFKRVSDAARGVQFAAISFLVGEKVRVVAFRGTDDTIAGWKEDCYLAFSQAVPAQLLAAQYLEATVDGRAAVICGHSKGGNLAMYAALYASEARLGDVRMTYNFDGPGFSFELRGLERYARVRERVVTVVPESSIVGMLLNHEEDYRIVESQRAGILQHDAMFWHVLGARFVYADRRNTSSVVIDRTLREWIAGMSFGERKEFVDAVFSVIEATGAVTLSELPERIAQGGFKALANSSPLSAQQKAMVLRLLLDLVKAGNGNLYATAMEAGDSLPLDEKPASGGRLSEAVDRVLDSLSARFGSKRDAPDGR